MVEIGNKFGLGSGSGVHFKEPWLFAPESIGAVNLQIADNATAVTTSATTAFFTEIALRGLQDQTNWTADTYKTILNVASGKGLVAAYVGCTAGAAETHTVRFTVDGVVTTIAIAVAASGQRAVLSKGGFSALAFTTASRHAANAYGALDAGKTTFGNVASVERVLMHWGMFEVNGTPLLRFNQSLLIEAKHSASITNSTATAYSGVMYRLGL
jgi:hypothetical protein